MSKFQTKQFKELQKEWYDKIKDSGFDDIEDTDSPNEFLKAWHSRYFSSKYDTLTFEAKEEYYKMAGDFLRSHKFSTKFETKVWTLHSQGRSLREIKRELKSKLGRVYKVVKDLNERMLHKK